MTDWGDARHTKPAVKTLASKARTTIERKRLNMDISTDLHRRLKQRALDEDRTATEIVEQLLNDYLSK